MATKLTWKQILSLVCKCQSNTELDRLFENLNKKGIKFDGELEGSLRNLSSLYNRLADTLYVAGFK